ncbi:MAG: hypothetical protein FWH40_01185 [Coriobacteriia bacterium]|nr:hypothetical protein [Coriobacteriia bacterium]
MGNKTEETAVMTLYKIPGRKSQTVAYTLDDMNTPDKLQQILESINIYDTPDGVEELYRMLDLLPNSYLLLAQTLRQLEIDQESLGDPASLLLSYLIERFRIHDELHVVKSKADASWSACDFCEIDGESEARCHNCVLNHDDVAFILKRSIELKQKDGSFRSLSGEEFRTEYLPFMPISLFPSHPIDFDAVLTNQQLHLLRFGRRLTDGAAFPSDGIPVYLVSENKAHFIHDYSLEDLAGFQSAKTQPAAAGLYYGGAQLIVEVDTEQGPCFLATFDERAGKHWFKSVGGIATGHMEANNLLECARRETDEELIVVGKINSEERLLVLADETEGLITKKVDLFSDIWQKELGVKRAVLPPIIVDYLTNEVDKSFEVLAYMSLCGLPLDSVFMLEEWDVGRFFPRVYLIDSSNGKLVGGFNDRQGLVLNHPPVTVSLHPSFQRMLDLNREALHKKHLSERVKAQQPHVPLNEQRACEHDSNSVPDGIYDWNVLNEGEGEKPSTAQGYWVDTLSPKWFAIAVTGYAVLKDGYGSERDTKELSALLDQKDPEFLQKVMHALVFSKQDNEEAYRLLEYLLGYMHDTYGVDMGIECQANKVTYGATTEPDDDYSDWAWANFTGMNDGVTHVYRHWLKDGRELGREELLDLLSRIEVQKTPHFSSDKANQKEECSHSFSGYIVPKVYEEPRGPAHFLYRCDKCRRRLLKVTDPLINDIQ